MNYDKNARQAERERQQRQAAKSHPVKRGFQQQLGWAQDQVHMGVWTSHVALCISACFLCLLESGEAPKADPVIKLHHTDLR